MARHSRCRNARAPPRRSGRPAPLRDATIGWRRRPSNAAQSPVPGAPAEAGTRSSWSWDLLPRPDHSEGPSAVALEIDLDGELDMRAHEADVLELVVAHRAQAAHRHP